MDTYYLDEGTGGFENGEEFYGARVFHRTVNGLFVADEFPDRPGHPSFLYNRDEGLLIPLVRWQEYEYDQLR
jgi:hypothetical protein